MQIDPEPHHALAPTPEATEIRKDARTIIAAYKAFLANPAFDHNIDLAVLAKVAADENVAPRERRRAAEMLARFRLAAMEMIAKLTGTKEQMLHELGIAPTSGPMNFTQVNTRVEIVRAEDWRRTVDVEALEDDS